MLQRRVNENNTPPPDHEFSAQRSIVTSNGSRSAAKRTWSLSIRRDDYFFPELSSAIVSVLGAFPKFFGPAFIGENVRNALLFLGETGDMFDVCCFVVIARMVTRPGEEDDEEYIDSGRGRGELTEGITCKKSSIEGRGQDERVRMG